MDADTINLLLEKWKQQGVIMSTQAGDPRETTCEAADRLWLSASFLRFLDVAGRLQLGSSDENLISFFPPSDMSVEHCSSSSDCFRETRIVFADYCIGAHLFQLRIKDGQDTGVYAIDGTNEVRVANSFDEFIKCYLDAPDRLVECWDIE